MPCHVHWPVVLRVGASPSVGRSVIERFTAVAGCRHRCARHPLAHNTCGSTIWQRSGQRVASAAQPHEPCSLVPCVWTHPAANDVHTGVKGARVQPGQGEPAARHGVPVQGCAHERGRRLRRDWHLHRCVATGGGAQCPTGVMQPGRLYVPSHRAAGLCCKPVNLPPPTHVTQSRRRVS